MLHKICQELTRENVSDFLFLCHNKIARSKLEEIWDPRDLIYVLEQLNIVGRHNLHFLSSVLTEIRRQDLAQKVKEHCRRQCSEGDSIAQHNSNSSVSLAATLLSDMTLSQESSNHAVSYRPARLEADDAEVLLRLDRCISEGLARDDRILCEELVGRGVPAKKDQDMPRYTMDKDPRGNTVAI